MADALPLCNRPLALNALSYLETVARGAGALTCTECDHKFGPFRVHRIISYSRSIVYLITCCLSAPLFVRVHGISLASR